MKHFFISIIRLYRRFISPLLPPACRFTPTCSEYALEAYEKKNVLRATWMTAARIAKCHPFHPGGYDPVNPAGEQNARENSDAVEASMTPSCRKMHGKS